MGGQSTTKEKCPEGQPDAAAEKRYGWGVRHVQMACMCACMTSLFVVRGCMSVAVPAMVDTARRNDTSVTIYDWDKETQGVILSSFFWGYMAMQVPGGLLAKRFGGKPILLVSLLANGLLCALLPVLALVGGWRVVCACRVGMGLAQACLFSASHTLLGRWLPARERTAISGIVYAGSILGTIISMPLSGVLAETAMGWTLIFYSMSALMLATAALWHALSASAPHQHRLMSPEEREYIERDLNVGAKGPRSLRTPWRQLVCSVPLWAIVATHFALSGAFTLFFVYMPLYLMEGLGISLTDSALLSMLPYVGMWLGNTFSGVLFEKISNSGILSLATCRRISNSISLYGVALGLVCLSFLGPENQRLAVAVLVGTHTAMGFSAAGFMMNHLDLSPNYAGVMLSMTNFLANINNVLTPILVGVMLGRDASGGGGGGGGAGRWRAVFLSVAALCAACNTLYVVFSRFERQPWDHPDFRCARAQDAEEMKPVLNQEKEKEANKRDQDNNEAEGKQS